MTRTFLVEIAHFDTMIPMGWVKLPSGRYGFEYQIGCTSQFIKKLAIEKYVKAGWNECVDIRRIK